MPDKIPTEKKEIKCCGKPLEFRLERGVDWQSYVPETATCFSCKSYFEKKPEKDFAYKKSNSRGSYKCTNCNSEVKGVTRAHPIWDGPGPCSGGGQCEYEQIPYCPKCEQEPTSSGLPIIVR
jgi:hypothetical protein